MRFFLAIAVLIPAHSVLAQSDPLFVIHGAGTWSCAKWQSSKTDDQIGSLWVTGYWTGRNAEAAVHLEDRRVGRTTDWPGILAEIRLSCSGAPSKTLEAISNQVYVSMLAARR